MRVGVLQHKKKEIKNEIIKYTLINLPYNSKSKNLIKNSISYGSINVSLYTYYAKF